MLKTKEDSPHYQRAVERFYEGISSPESWQEGLQLLTVITKSKMVFIFVWDELTGHAKINEYLGIPEKIFREQTESHHKFNPSKGFVTQLGLRNWNIVQHNIDDPIINHSRYYQELLRGNDICSILTTKLFHQNGVHGYLSMPRLVGEEPFSYNHIKRLSPLLSHFQRALRLRLTMQSLTMQASHASAALDCIHLPLCIVDETGMVQLTNKHLESFVRRHPGLKITNGVLSVPSCHKKCLADLFRKACNVEGVATAGGCQLTEQKEASIQSIVTPLPPSLTVTQCVAKHTALVILYDGMPAEKSRNLVLRQIFGLTPTEERLCHKLLQRASLEQAADELHVSIATIRSHLKTIFRKTGTCRQVDLMQMLCVHLFT